MKFTPETEERVVWTADEHMAYYNLPSQLAQHWSYVHELNGYLMEHVKIITNEFVTRRPLNPPAQEFHMTII